ncbi:MAG: hypothetical protein ACOYMI_07675 [Phycisphaerales bacterium]|jgi:hypothetical protein
MSAKLDLAALKNIDFSKVAAVLKRRWIMMLCGLVVVAAPVAAFLVQQSMDEENAKVVKTRVALFDSVGSLRKGSVTIRMPDGTSKEESTALNDAVIKKIREHNEELGKRSEEVYAAAVKRNQSAHVMIPGLDAYLPAPQRADEATRDILLQKWAQLVEPARAKLLDDPSLQGPVPSSEALERVRGAEVQFCSANRVASRAELPAGEMPKLLDALREARVGAAVDHAGRLDFYMDPGAIRWLPRPSGGKADGPAAVDEILVGMYRAQWDLWLVSDLLKAFRGVNAKQPGGPMKSPLKRVVAVEFDTLGLPKPSSGGAAEGADAASGGEGEAIDPKKEVAPDFKAGGLTGLVSNHLFDVRTTVVDVVIETAAIPALVNELARCNFITVADVRLKPADSFEALRRGYAYGGQPCSDLRLTLQSVWLRDWTTERMPVALLKTIKSAGKPKPEAPTDGAPAAPAGA